MEQAVEWAIEQIGERVEIAAERIRIGQQLRAGSDTG